MMFRNTLLFIFVILSFAKISLAKEIVIHDKLFIATLNDIYTNLDDYGDILVTFEGNLVRGSFDDPDFAGTEYPFVYRLGPGCCYNDLYAGMYLEYDGNIPPDDTWVKVSGKPFYFEHNGFTELFLKVESLEIMEKKGSLEVKD
ncbi:MAG: hypothetical protein II733_04140 [Succinivibrio sp.]|nr:hypothetical protein [Succinivibrio sp.]